MQNIKNSKFKDKILIPMLYDNAMKKKQLTHQLFKKQKIGQNVVLQKKKYLYQTIKNLHKAKDENKAQTIYQDFFERGSSNSFKKSPQKINLDKRYQKQKCHHSQKQGKRYYSTLEKLNLETQIKRRMFLSKNLLRTLQQDNLKKIQNYYQLNYEQQIPKFNEFRWIMQSQNYQQQRMEDIRKKMEMLHLKPITLAQIQKKQKDIIVKDFMENIAKETYDANVAVENIKIKNKFYDIPGFIEQQQLKLNPKIKKINQNTSNQNLRISRLQNNSKRLSLQNIKSSKLHQFIESTDKYKEWIDVVNPKLRGSIDKVQQMIRQEKPKVHPYNILQHLRDLRMKQLQKINN